jgi:hypothetical protein
MPGQPDGASALKISLLLFQPEISAGNTRAHFIFYLKNLSVNNICADSTEIRDK